MRLVGTWICRASAMRRSFRALSTPRQGVRRDESPGWPVLLLVNVTNHMVDPGSSTDVGSAASVCGAKLIPLQLSRSPQPRHWRDVDLR